MTLTARDVGKPRLEYGAVTVDERQIRRREAVARALGCSGPSLTSGGIVRLRRREAMGENRPSRLARG